MEPEVYISADDSFDIVLIDGRILITDSIPIRTIFVSTDDCILVQKGYPVIRNEGRKQKGMSSSTLRTADTADPERTGTIRKKDAPRIVSVDGQTGRMPTGTFQLVKLDVINDRIVIILRKLVVITDRNEYHGLVRHSLNGCD